MTNTETTEPTDRVARFKSDVAEMRLSDPRASRDRMWGIVGGILMVLGIALTVVAYFQSHDADFAFNSSGPATQRDALIIALIGVTVAIVGAALFLRYTLAQFLRFWLARLIYEQQAQTDRVVEATQSR
jgi:uncharacterized membrane protein YidH (DUF202 family)